MGHTIGHSSLGHSSLALRNSLVKERLERLDHHEEKEKASAAFESSLQAVAGASKMASDSDDSDGGPSFDELSHAAAQQLDSLERLSKVLSRVMDSKTSGNDDADDDDEENQDISSDLNLDSKHGSPFDKPIHETKPGPKDPGEKLKLDIEASICDNLKQTTSGLAVKKEVLGSEKQGIETTLGQSRSDTTAKKETHLENIQESMRLMHSSRGKSKMKDYTLLDSLRDTLGGSSLSRHSSLDKRKEFTLESLTSSEARAMSGLLRQASLEKVGSSRIGNVTVTSASRNRVTGNYTLGNSSFTDGRITTPDGRLLVRTVTFL